MARAALAVPAAIDRLHLTTTGVNESVAGEIPDVITGEPMTGVGIMHQEIHAGDMTNHSKDVMPRRCHGGDADLWRNVRKMQPVRREIQRVDDMAEEIQ